MVSNIFLKKKNKVQKLFPKIKISQDFQVNDIKPLDKAKNMTLLF